MRSIVGLKSAMVTVWLVDIEMGKRFMGQCRCGDDDDLLSAVKVDHEYGATLWS